MLEEYNQASCIKIPSRQTLTINKYSSLLFTRAYSFFTCCRHFKHLHTRCSVTSTTLYSKAKLPIQNSPIQVLFLTKISKSTTCILHSLCTYAVRRDIIPCHIFEFFHDRRLIIKKCIVICVSRC